MANLSDPTAEFIKGLHKDARKRGAKIANELFTGEMAKAMGEVCGDILLNGIVAGLGNSLFDVPMQEYHG